MNKRKNRFPWKISGKDYPDGTHREFQAKAENGAYITLRNMAKNSIDTSEWEVCLVEGLDIIILASGISTIPEAKRIAAAYL